MQQTARLLWQGVNFGSSKRALLDVDGGSFRCKMGIGTPGFADSVAPCKEEGVRIAWNREGRNKDGRTGARTAGQDGSNLIKRWGACSRSDRGYRLSLERFRFRCGCFAPPKKSKGGGGPDIKKY